MTTYSQRYAAGDSNTAGAFYFDTITAVDYAATKIGYGAAGSVTWVDASNPLPVSVIAALPAGTNAIGKLAANSGVDIGDVDVTSIIPGTGATNLGKAIDTATGATDTGVLLLATRDDALSAITPVDGDNAQLRVDANGALWVVVSGTVSVSDGGGTLSIDDGGSSVSIDDGGGSLTVDGTVTANQGGSWTVAATQSGTWNVGTVSTVTAVTTVSTVTNVSTIGTSVTPGTAAANLGKAEDAAHNHADTGVFVLAVRRDTAAAGADVDGDYASLNVDATGRLWCNVSNTVTVASHAVTNAGTFAVQVDGTALTRLTDIETNTDYGATTGNGTAAGSLRVTLANDSTGVLATVSTLTGSGVAHDAADSGNPHKIGAKATTALSGVTLVADADRTDLRAGVDGVLIVRNGYSLEDVVQERTTNTDGAATAFASGLGAPGAGVRLWVTKVTIANSSSSFCTVDLRDGSGGAVLWTIPVPATGGAIERFDPPLKLTANTALAFDASAATSTLSISANGFKSKV